MATWQEGNGAGFLAGIGRQNDNAPNAGDNALSLDLIRQNNDIQRSDANNVGLQALQGLAGFADTVRQTDLAKATQQFNQVHANAWATGDNSGLVKFAQQNPAFVAQAQQAVSGLNDQQRGELGTLAMQTNTALAQGPEAYSKFVNSNSDRLKRVGADPGWMLQTGISNPEQLSHLTTTMALGAVGPDKMFDVQDKAAGRQLEQGRLNESIRSHQASEANTVRGQNLSYQSAMTGHGLAAERLALDKQKFGLEVQQAQQKAGQLINAAPKLSVNMEKSIEKSVNDSAASSNSADSMSALAQQFRQEKPTTGLFGNASNMFAKVTGSDTALRDLRIRQNALVNNQVLRFLPPGPATDRDVEIVRQGAPTDMDNPEVVARWLDSMSRLERRSAQFNDFKAEWMSANGNPGQSRVEGQILGMDVKKGESLGSAAKRYMANNPIDTSAPATTAGKTSQQSQQPAMHTSKSGIQFTVK